MWTFAAFENSGIKSVLLVVASLIVILHKQHKALVVRKAAGKCDLANI